MLQKNATIEALSTTVPMLVELRLRGCLQLSDEVMSDVAQRLNLLAILDVTDCGNVPEDTMAKMRYFVPHCQILTHPVPLHHPLWG